MNPVFSKTAMAAGKFFVAAGYRRRVITHGGFAGGKFPFVVHTVS
jgi:hypothetical protein